MKRPATWLLLLLPVLAAPLYAAPPAVNSGSPLSACGWTAACAVELARDTAFRHFGEAGSIEERTLSIKALEWAGYFDAPGDEALRSRFAVLLKQLEAIPDYQQESLRDELADALAAYGFLEGATAQVALIPSEDLRNLRQGSLACVQVRRGNLREAFAMVQAIKDQEHASLAFSKVAGCIARTGNPELARAAAQYIADSPPKADQVASILANTEQRAGHAAAARASAMSIKDGNWRMDLLFQMVHRYRAAANYPESIATERLLIAEAAKLGDAQTQVSARAFLLTDLITSGAHAEVLALLADISASARARAFGEVFSYETDPDVIREVGKRLPQLSADERKPLETGLLFARVRIGELKPAEALKLARDPHQMAEGLLRMSRELAKDQPARAREALQAAISAIGPQQNLLWGTVAIAQAELGLLAEAHQTIDRRISDPDSRGLHLVGVGGVEAMLGKADEAARSRAEGIRLMGSKGFKTDEYTLSDSLMYFENPVQAQVELLAGLKKQLPGLDYRGKAVKVTKALVKQGDLERAMDLARALSQYLQYSPEPFTDFHYALTREGGPLLY